MGDQSTSSKGHPPHHASSAESLPDAGSESGKHEIAPPSPPYPSEVTDIFKTTKVWKGDKDIFHYAMKKSKIKLGNAAVATTRPIDSNIERHQGQLEKVYGRMKGWHEYFKSEEGKQKADTEGRRAISARNKMETTEKWHNLVDTLKPKDNTSTGNKKRRWYEAFTKAKPNPSEELKRWQQTADAIPGRIDEIEREYRQAEDHKRATHRHYYGLFQSHVVHDGGDPNEIPFESSQEAHKRLRLEKEQRKKELKREQEQGEQRKRKRTPV